MAEQQLSDGGVSTDVLLEHVGRNDAGHTKYHDRRYWQSDAKNVERERVLEYMLNATNDFPEGVGIRLLSLPGINWTFEQMLLRERPHAQLVGIEKYVSVYLNSRCWIPGYRHLKLDDRHAMNERSMDYGRGQIRYSRVIRSTDFYDVTARSHRLLLMDSETYASMLITDYGSTLQQREQFNERFNRRNAIWLDFTSQLCKSVENTIRNILWCLDPQTFRKPVVISIMNARDSMHGEQSRIERVIYLRPELQYRDHWTYNGKGNISMLTMCFAAVEPVKPYFARPVA